MRQLIFLLVSFSIIVKCQANSRLIVVNTWAFNKATDVAFESLKKGSNAIDAIVEGCTEAENDPNIDSVGYGGSPSETGNVTLDAMLMDGVTMNVGAVAAMPYVKNAIKVAYQVLKKTKHSLLCGNAAAEFAKSCGFKWEELETDKSKALYYNWINVNCQPNYRTAEGWKPDPSKNCGPYTMMGNSNGLNSKRPETVNYNNHDTIGMIVIDEMGNIAAGTSTNGANHKINGRIGDSPIPGAGAYAKNSVGAAVATGDGDIIMRYSLTFRVVLLMEQGVAVRTAIQDSLKSIKPNDKINIALLAIDINGNHAAGCIGFQSFPFSVRGIKFNQTSIITIDCN